MSDETSAAPFEGWAIDRDYLAEGDEPSRVGYGMRTREAAETMAALTSPFQRITVETGLRAADVKDPVRFRAMDEDGEVYYGGAVTASWITDEDDEAGTSAYLIDKFVEADAGATVVQYRAADLPEAFVEVHRKCRAIERDQRGGEWVIVYG